MTPKSKSNSELLEEIAQLKAQVKKLEILKGDVNSAQKSLDRSVADYFNLVELAVDAIFMGDSQGIIIGVNQSAVRLTGYPKDELIGTNLGALFSAEEHAQNPLRYDLLKVGKILQNDRILTRKDGSKVPVGMNSRMMPDGTYHTFMRDYTERKEIEEQRLSLIRELEACTYAISHDLRNPLTPIIGYTEILQTDYKEQLDENGLHLLNEIEKSCVEMMELLDGLLSLVHANGHSQPAEPVDVDEVVERIVQRLENKAIRASVTLRVNPLPAVHMSKTFLIQIFENLITNAINYAGIQDTIVEVGGEQEGERTRFFVRDHGVGIPEHERKKIFELFYRSSHQSKNKGTGLGLAIVQKSPTTTGETLG